MASYDVQLSKRNFALDVRLEQSVKKS